MAAYDKYEMVIGLETHVQLSTRSKAFCADDASFGGQPNTHISAISLAYPGTLPRINEKQVEYAVRLGLALGCKINQENRFDRKNYFYADLPKGFQTTQDALPICVGGALTIRVDGQQQTIRIHHIHMEEDAGKSMHDQGDDFSLIDLNRAGVPLLEIVSEPDLRSAEEVDAFMNGMRQLVRYLGISDGNMEEGSMRCDVNVSVRPKGSDVLNERCEIKNINSMKFAKQAIEYEFKRQVDLMEAGKKVRQQTLHFDRVKGSTSPLREKEDAHDYRYFPEPDLPPVLLTEAFLTTVREKMPALPWQLFQEFTEELGLPEYDAELLTEERPTAIFFKDLIQHTKNYKTASNLIINKINPWLKEQQLEIPDFPVSHEQLAAFLQLVDDGKISNSIAYQRIFPELLTPPEESPLAIAERLNLLQTSDEDFLTKIVAEVVEKHPDKVTVYRKGKKGLLGFFMGEIMKASKGKADPRATKALLQEQLEG